MVKYTVAGAFLGFSWGAALRAWMVLLALEFGDQPQFNWLGTFVFVLFSATIMGGILGGAEYARQVSGNKNWRWAAAAPLSLIILPLLFMDNFISTLLMTGEGGGAISVALGGLFGGYALANRGNRWLRVVSGLLFLAVVFGTVSALYFSEIINGIYPTAGRTFCALFFVSLMILLALGSSVPFKIRAG